jgi:UDP-N-acetylmuramate--alanine ligase
MSALALICAARGGQVGGSDTDITRLEALAAAGCAVRQGHDAPPPLDSTCVVVSTAISDDNPQVAVARTSGIPVVHRAQVLGKLLDRPGGIAVTGTHGKSSVTAMTATIFSRLGHDPSYAVGAPLTETGSNAHHGTGALLIAEADESDRSFYFLHPAMAVITNIQFDHPENYENLDTLLDAYTRFAGGIADCGSLLISADDPGAVEVTRRLRDSRPDLRVFTYGEAPGADWHISCITTAGAGMSSQTTVITPDGHPVTVNLPVPGRMMAVNAVAAVAAAAQAGAPAGAAAIALGGYQGVHGRLTMRGDPVSGVLMLDSHAHHPTAITADLEAARTLAGDDSRVIVVFEPCGYVRTAAMAPEMAVALKQADLVLLLPIRTSVGPDVPGVTSKLIADAGTGRLAGPVEAAGLVTEAARSGDVVLVMGTSADLALLADRICAALGASRPARM